MDPSMDDWAQNGDFLEYHGAKKLEQFHIAIRSNIINI
jgi:hypothetical protein